MNIRQISTIAVSGLIVTAMAVALINKSIDSGFAISGIWTVIPPLAAISLAFVTQNVVLSLLVGVLVGSFLLNVNGNLFESVSASFIVSTEYMLEVISDSWNAGIVLQCLTIGGCVGVITRLGGARSIAKALSKFAKGRISAQIVAFFMSVVIFFDDYAGAIIAGPIARPITDKFKISRERLCFIIDSTAAPIAGIALISTWIGAEISYIKSGLDLAGITDISPYALFVSTIPYRFYNILAIAFVVISSVMLRDYGPMVEAQNKVFRDGFVSGTETDANSEMDPLLLPKDENSSIWLAVIPLAILVFGSFIGFYLNGRAAILESGSVEAINIMVNHPFSFDALREAFGEADASIVIFQVALFASVAAILLGVLAKKFNIAEGIEVWLAGVKNLMIIGVILILVWALTSTVYDLEMAAFLVEALEGTLPVFLLPAIIFALAALTSFATGTSFGTMGILLPMAIPLAHQFMPGDMGFLYACSGAVLTGAIFGDHCTPISDTTILSAMGCSCDILAHVKTQMPYALTVAGITLVFAYLPMGLGVSLWVLWPICLGLIVLVLFLFGKRTDKINEN